MDRVEDVTAISLPDESAGTVLCIETFEHVFEVRRAFDEVFRLLKPGGIFVITSPLNFRIHGYPDDYWRMTPNCLRRMLGPTPRGSAGYQGYHAFPHTVMGVGHQGPGPARLSPRKARAARRGLSRLARAEPRRALPLGEKLRRLALPDLSLQGRAAPDRRLLRGRLHDRPRGGLASAGLRPRIARFTPQPDEPDSQGSPVGPRSC